MFFLNFTVDIIGKSILSFILIQTAISKLEIFNIFDENIINLIILDIDISRWK